MKRQRTAEEIGSLRIEMAARQGKPWAGPGGIGGDIYILHMPAAREVPLPEPVTWRDLNGRDPEWWEEPLIVAARTRERRLELAQLSGTLGQP